MEFTEDDENMDPEIPEEQRTILDRMRRLSGETGGDVVTLSPFSVSSRLNFGLPGPEKGPHISEKPKLIVKPPPGFLAPSSLQASSSNGLNLSGLDLSASSGSSKGAPLSALTSRSHPDTHSGSSVGLLASSHLSSARPSLGMLASSSQSSSGANKPTLGMLASSHLSNAQSPSESSGLTPGANKPTLGMLASSHFSSTQSSSHLGGSKPSLGMLASSHLSSASGLSSANKPSLDMLASSHLTLNPKPSSLLSSTDNHSLGALASSTPMLSSLGSSGSDNMPSLGLLASNHLSSGKPDSNLGENVLGVKCVSPIQSDINLLSALKLSSEEEIKPKEELVIRKQEEDVPNIDIFVSKRTFGKMKSILRMRGKTPFAFPLTR